MKLQMELKMPKNSYAPSFRRALLALGALGAFAASALSGSAASSIQDLGGTGATIGIDNLFGNSGSSFKRLDNDSGQQIYHRPYIGPYEENYTEVAIRWADGTEIGLGAPSGNNSTAVGITSDGWVFGNSDRGFVWKPDEPNGKTSDAGATSIGSFGGSYSYINDFNEQGQAVGHSGGGSAHESSQAFVWTYGVGMAQIFFEENWGRSSAGAINNSGLVAGVMQNSVPGPGYSVVETIHLFRWTDDGEGSMAEDLGLLASVTIDSSSLFRYVTAVKGITESGAIVGIRQSEGNVLGNPFIWTEGGGIQDMEMKRENILLNSITALDGDRIYGTVLDMARVSLLPEDLLFILEGGGEYQPTEEEMIRFYVTLAVGYIWTEEEGVRYLDELFADRLLTAEQLQEGTIAGWVTVLATGGSSDEQMTGYGYWWDGETQTISERHISLSLSAAVPEPAAWAALTGLAALLAWAAMRRSRDAHG
jgi:hypothetical protein